MLFEQTQGSTRGTLAIVTALMVGAAALGGAGPVCAQPSDKPVRFILPVSAGSGVDTITRTIAPALSRALGQTVVIENQPGAGGIVGTSALVKAAPDGTTLSMVSNNHVIYPSVYKTLPFDPIADITPISVLGGTPLVVVASAAKVAATNARELIAMLKAKPGAYNYASSGNGTILHLAGHMFIEEAGVDAKHIPYKGVAPMVQDLIGGQVEFGVLALLSVQAHIKAGTLRAIGVGTPKRVAAAPDIPTIAEQGVPGYLVDAWIGVIGPAKLPVAEVKRIHAAFVTVFETPEVREAMAKQGNAMNPGTPEAAAQFFKSELDKYARIVKKAGVQLQ